LHEEQIVGLGAEASERGGAKVGVAAAAVHQNRAKSTIVLLVHKDVAGSVLDTTTASDIAWTPITPARDLAVDVTSSAVGGATRAASSESRLSLACGKREAEHGQQSQQRDERLHDSKSKQITSKQAITQAQKSEEVVEREE